MSNRRQFLINTGLGVAGTLLAQGCHSPRNAGAPVAAAPLVMGPGPVKAITRRPTLFIQIHLQGGLDAILATDPKTKAMVDPRVDVPYEESAIVELPNGRFGPQLASWSRFLPRFACINGVACETVSHPIGRRLIEDMHRHGRDRGLRLCGALGRELLASTHALSCVWIHRKNRTPLPLRQLDALDLIPVPPDWPKDTTPLQLLDAAASDDAVATAIRRVLEQRAGDPQIGDNYNVIAKLLDRWPKQRVTIEPLQPPNDPVLWAKPFDTDLAEYMREWQTTIPFIATLAKHRLTPAIFLAPTMDFDSHQRNLGNQSRAIGGFELGFLKLLEVLESTRFADTNTSILDETAILISSELGRFPFLNAMHGKDHFPELPFMLLGPGLRPGIYGKTNDVMRALPVSFDSGKASTDHRAGVPVLEDVGTTVLNWFGVADPVALGYPGQNLDFLFS